MTRIVGWDIGAANIKAALLEEEDESFRVASQPFEIWRSKHHLGEALRSVLSSVSHGTPPSAMAVTMTAELSDVFETKREGVLFILDVLEGCFSKIDKYIFNLSGEFVYLNEARKRPLDFAASNWLAMALWIAGQHPDCLLLDVGSTTTDILPVAGGVVRTTARSDLERLASGELLYTGALRTNVAAIVQSIPVGDSNCRVSSEYFAISGDVHLILGRLDSNGYTCPTPDGRMPSVSSARARLARLVCADTEMLSIDEIDEMARYIGERQVDQIAEGIEQVLSRYPRLRKKYAFVCGSGAFLGISAAKRAGLDICLPDKSPGRESSPVMPCLAVAHLLKEHLRKQSR